MLCYAETGAPLTRSDSEVDELLAQVYELIGENELGAASSKILAAEKPPASAEEACGYQ